MIRKDFFHRLDIVTLFLIFLLSIIGIVFVSSASISVASKIGLNPYYFAYHHIIYMIISFIIIYIVLSLDWEKIKFLSIIGFIVCITLLVLIFFIGTEIKGSKRWIYLYGFSIQPSEIIKPFFFICIAILLEAEKFLFSLILYILTIGLIILQPDLGMSILITAVYMLQVFISGISLRKICILIGIFVLISVFSYFTFSHIQIRLNSFFKKSEQNFQTEKSIKSFINGGFLGVGIGNGAVKNSLPDAHTDFIFAVIGEEGGFITCVIVIMIYFYIFYRLIKNIHTKKTINILDSYELAQYGFIFQIGLQAIINIGVTIGLLPTKGMTLPMISYGGSASITSAISFAILLAINKTDHSKKIKFYKLISNNKKIFNLV
ncbi:MAG: FtsW/RodA/SpoVE family cell cycle protein [Anaplasmataceae bacterium]|nr:FtsW/RodA/SpoVE family cell cycle protein [Anaplasmataceae bacterium]